MVLEPIRFNQKKVVGVYRDIKPYTNGRFQYHLVGGGHDRWFARRIDAVTKFSEIVKRGR